MYPAPIGGFREYIIEMSSFYPPLIVKDWRFACAIALLPESFTYEEALDIWDRNQNTSLMKDEIWTVATQCEVVIQENESNPHIHRYKNWKAYGWSEASVYQEATRDYPFVKMDEPNAFAIDKARMERYLSQTEVPSNYLSFPSEFSINLRKINDSESANDLIIKMSPNQKRGLDGLSLLFDICFGEREKINFNVQGSFIRKSIPSGGARHPTEILFVAFLGGCVPSGVYHYNVESNTLDCIQSGDFYKDFEFATFDLFKKFKKNPVGLIIFTSLYERSMWRYRDARSWRAVLIDVGHAIMSFRTVITSLGYKTYTYQKFRDKELCKLLKLDSVRQTPQYVGTLV